MSVKRIVVEFLMSAADAVNSKKDWLEHEGMLNWLQRVLAVGNSYESELRKKQRSAFGKGVSLTKSLDYWEGTVKRAL
jgi:hypothetical protein